MVIDAAVVERDLADLARRRPRGCPRPCTAATICEPDFRRLLRESETGGLATLALREAALRMIMIELARLAGTAPDGVPTSDDADADLRRAIVYVDRHFREPLTLAEVACAGPSVAELLQ